MTKKEVEQIGKGGGRRGGESPPLPPLLPHIHIWHDDDCLTISLAFYLSTTTNSIRTKKALMGALSLLYLSLLLQRGLEWGHCSSSSSFLLPKLNAVATRFLCQVKLGKIFERERKYS